MLNPKTLYTLRTAGRPVPRHDLVGLYEAPERLDQELGVLARHGLAHVHDEHVAWVGS